MVQFNAEEDVRLIELVRAREFMWNMKDPGFKDHVKRDATWRGIGKLLNKSAVDVQKRWKHMRDHYRRQIKEETTTGKRSVIKKRAMKKRAVYWTKLQFLDSEGDGRELNNDFSEELPLSVELNAEENSCNDIGIDEIDSNSQENLYEVELQGSHVDLEPPLKKRKENTSLTQCLTDTEDDKRDFKKFLQDLVKSSSQEDEIDVFFKSMAMTVKKFRPDLMTKAKIKVFQNVMEVEVLNQKI